MSENEAPRSGRTRSRRANVQGGRKNRVAEVWADDAEAAALLVRAREANVTIPRLLVESALAPEGGATVTERRAFLAELYGVRRLLAANSNNLNQLTKAVNAGQPARELADPIRQTLAAIDGLIAQVDQMLRDEVIR